MKKGIIAGLGVIDLTQGVYTMTQIGAIEAAKQAAAGEIEAAGNTLVERVSSPGTWIGLVVGNILIGWGGKMIRKYSPPKIKRYL